MNIYTFTIIGCLFTILIGSLFHFTHGIFKKVFILHFFSAVNESTWEHMKLAFMPTMIVGLTGYFLFKDINWIESSLYSALISSILIPLIYYPVRYLLKNEIVWISISIFILSVIVGYLIQMYVLNKGLVIFGEVWSFVIYISLFILFSYFTFYPPKNFLFEDPVSGKYGHN